MPVRQEARHSSFLTSLAVPCPGSAVKGIKKLRRTFTIEPELLDRLRAIKVRTGLSESEQVRQGIRWWLGSREWPARKTEQQEEPAPKPCPAPARGRKRQ